jgi:hypothetical protein
LAFGTSVNMEMNFYIIFLRLKLFVAHREKTGEVKSVKMKLKSSVDVGEQDDDDEQYLQLNPLLPGLVRVRLVRFRVKPTANH